MIADRLRRRQRKLLGWALVTAGAVSTIPLALQLFGKRRDEPRPAQEPPRYRQAPAATEASAMMAD